MLLEQYAGVQQQQQHVTGVRLLLESSVAPLLIMLLLPLLLLSARVPLIAWPRRACVCLVLVTLE